MSEWLRETRLALRSLLRSPGFTVVVLLTFALGIGATTAIFSLVRGVLLRDLPFPQAEQLTTVWERAPQGGNERNPVNAGNFLRWRERSRSFSRLSAMVPWNATLGGRDAAPQRVKIGYVSSEFFDTLGIPAALGRGFLEVEGTPGHDAVVVLSDGLWRRQFGADPAVIGRDVSLDGETVRVVGVASPQVDMPPGTEVWNPIAFAARHREARGRAYGVLGRLRAGVTVEQAQAEMDAIAGALARERPEVDTGWGINVVPLRLQLVGGVRTGLLVLFGAVGSLLLIACANLANLWLVRATARQRETALRSALGGGSARLLRGPLVEAALLAAAGGAAGIAVARLGLDLLLRSLPKEVPAFLHIEMDGAALAFAAGVTAAVALLVAWLPARRAAASDAARVLTGARGASRDGGMRRTLVIAEVALALVLTLATGLLARSLLRLQRVDVGFSPAGVEVAQIDLPAAGYGEPARIRAFYDQLLERLRAVPGVTEAGAISWLPLGGPGSATSFYRSDKPAPKAGEETVAEVRIVTPGLFPALRMPVLAGRAFDAHDDAAAPARAVVSAAVARDLFPERDPLGQTLTVAWGPDPKGLRVEIVGVVADARLTRADTPARYAVYLPAAQGGNNFMTVALRGTLPAAAMEQALRDGVRALDAQVAVGALRPLDAVAAEARRQPRFLTLLLSTFAGAALLLAALGVYGVLAYGVASRRREIGIRLAVGARAGQIAGLVVGDGLRPAGLGVAAGLLAAAFAMRLLRSLLFEVAPFDPVSWVGACAVLAGAALLACLLPALRAARVQPASVLRQD